jgi:amino acid adenylation domain-containing protein/thioester reductase-like protein
MRPSFVSLPERVALHARPGFTSPALIHGATSVSYSELDRQATRLARRLRQRGIAPGQLVGVAIDRSVELVVAILGVLRAGAAFLPMDPSYPAERLRWMIRDSELACIVAQDELVPSFAASAPALAVGALLDPALRLDDEAALPAIQAGDLAYVIYTSGSTGTPKGVMVEHGGVSLLADYLQATLPLGAGARVLQFASSSFDAMVWELAMALGSGAALVLAERATLADPFALRELIRAQQVTVATLPPSLLAIMPAEGLGCLQTLVSAGEACGEQVARRWAPGRTFINAYGPTECTVCATLTPWTVDERDAPSIGRPLPYVGAHILDEGGHPVAPGAAGQLYLSGPALARGYLRRPELTAERFVRLPAVPEARLYATGDVVRLRPDGALDFIGRADDQIKIHGHRVELGEVEAVLQRHPAVRLGAVVVTGDEPAQRRLRAFVVGREGEALAPATLRDWLAARLPAWMLPATITLLEALPITANGKIDRAALRALDAGSAPGGEAAPPLPNTTEATIAAIWSGLLGREAIGLDDSFFDLGGDSLRAAAMLVRLHERLGAAPPLSALFGDPTLRGWSAQVELALLAAAPDAEAGGVTAGEGGHVMLAGQQQLLLLDQLARPLPLYHETVTLAVRGPLEPDSLRWSLAALMRRHPLLAATLAGPLRLAQQAAQNVPLREHRLDGQDTGNPACEARRLAREEASHPFDRPGELLWRVLSLRLADDKHELVFVFHHAIVDGISLAIVLEDLALLYQAHRAGAVAEAHTPYDWVALAAAERRWLASDGAAAQRAYWRRRLAGAERLSLPLAESDDAVVFSGRRLSAELDAGLVAEIDAAARRAGATRFTVLAAALATLLARYSGQTDLLIGTTASTRGPATPRSVGYLVNTLPLRIQLEAGELAFGEVVGRAREALFGALANKELPFSEIAPLLRETGADALRLLPVMITLEPELPALPAGWTARPSELDLGVSKFDLAFSFEARGEGLRLSVQHADRFKASTIARMLGHFVTLLRGALAEPLRSIWRLPLLGDAERRRLLHDWMPPAQDAPLLPELVRAAALHAGQAPAVVSAERAISYAELLGQAELLAASLRERGVGPNVAVGVCVQPGISVVVAAYAVWLAGGAYLPLDPALPDERLRWMLRDSRAAAVIAEAATAPRLGAATPLIPLDELPPAPAVYVPRQLPATAPQQRAYIIYTSGSTGQPKGVAVSHASLANLVAWHRRAFELKPGDRTTQIAGLGFDAVVWELWPTLAAGGTLYVCDSETRLVPSALQSWLLGCGITVAFVPTPLAEQLLALRWPAAAPLRYLLTGGDVLHHAPPAGLPFTLVNNYGPTENTVVATSGSIAPGAGGIPDIGRPIAGTRAYLLDPRHELVPIRAVGELFLGGAQVAEGYVGRDDLTAERFIPDPFLPGGRLYATGDLMRWREDGRLEFLGRNDAQVKIRGQRIELGEIEAALLRVAPLAASAVVVQQAASGEKSLVAFGVPQGAAAALDAETVRVALAAQLPAAMVPRQVILLEALPLTANGKVDRAALLQKAARSVPLAYRAPRSATEQRLAACWARLLGIDERSIAGDADFFDLGGSSLLVAQLVADIAEVFAVNLALATVFSDASLERMAAQIDRRQQGILAAPLDLNAECVLDADIAGAALPHPRANAFERVLLTGATGFFGAALLAELLQSTRATIYCLVRADDEAAGLARIRQALARYADVHVVDERRVVVRCGDLAAPQLGLGEGLWQELATTIDTIIHCGALVNFVFPYERLKAANVGGTAALLRLSAAGGGIPLHYVSTGGVFGASSLSPGAPPLREDTPIEPSGPHLYLGYLQSKWVAERLVWAAGERGLPVAIYRPGVVMGDARSGICNKDDYMSRMILGCLQLGMYPDVPERKAIVPVDFAARALVAIARQHTSFGRAFHLVDPNSQTTVTSLFAQLEALGYELRRVPRHEWIAALTAADAASNALAPLAFIFAMPVVDGLTLFDLFEYMPAFAADNTLAAISGSGLSCHPVDHALVAAWMRYFARSEAAAALPAPAA